MTHPAEGSETGAELMPRSIWADIPMKEVTGDTYRASVRTELPTFDPVQRPAHYASGDIECIDAIKVALQGETNPFVAYLRGQVMKYAWRTGKKDDAVQDLEKAEFYLRRAIAEKREEARDA